MEKSPVHTSARKEFLAKAIPKINKLLFSAGNKASNLSADYLSFDHFNNIWFLYDLSQDSKGVSFALRFFTVYAGPNTDRVYNWYLYLQKKDYAGQPLNSMFQSNGLFAYSRGKWSGKNMSQSINECIAQFQDYLHTGLYQIQNKPLVLPDIQGLNQKVGLWGEMGGATQLF